MIGADAIIRCLEAEGVDTVYGYPGVAICPFYNSILDSDIQTILVRTEQSLVQIPCIERNAVAANRAMNACNLSYFLTGSRNISYDMVCRAMHETGINLSHRFRETSEGGLAKIYARRK